MSLKYGRMPAQKTLDVPLVMEIHSRESGPHMGMPVARGIYLARAVSVVSHRCKDWAMRGILVLR